MARILFVDDQPATTGSHLEALVDGGHDVAFYSDVDALIEHIESVGGVAYDLVILDLAMPPRTRLINKWRDGKPMVGYLVWEFLRERGYEGPLVILSNFAHHGHLEKGAPSDSKRQILMKIDYPGQALLKVVNDMLRK